jgi:4-amino-4-deoxy-L-arabinose transferase-like glycosyltransferase
MIVALGDLVRGKVFLAILVGFCALYFRATAVQTTIVDEPLRADAGEYYFSAYNLVRYGIYSRSPGQLANPPQSVKPDAYRPPGLPIIIAALLYLSPDGTTIVRSVQFLNILAGTAAAIALFLAATAIFALPAAFAAGLLAAASPHLVAVSVYLLTEPYAILLTAVLLMVAAIRIPDNGPSRAAYFLALGALVGGLSLFRPIFIAFAPLLCFAFETRRDRIAALLLGCAGAACVVAPWMIRNALTVTDGSGSLIAATMLDGSYRGYVYNGDLATFPYARFADPMFETARQTVARALDEIRLRIAADPLGMALWYLIEKPTYLLRWGNVDGAGDVFVYPVLASPFSDDPLFLLTHRIYAASHDLIVVLAAIGGSLVWIKPVMQFGGFGQLQALRMASLMLIFLYAAHLPFFAATRYALPTFPALYLLFLIPLVLLARLFRDLMSDRAPFADRTTVQRQLV